MHFEVDFKMSVCAFFKGNKENIKSLKPEHYEKTTGVSEKDSNRFINRKKALK